MTTIKETASDRAYGEIDPMLCKSVKTVKECTVNKKTQELIPSIMEPKLDGYRAMARANSDGSIVMWTRGKKYIHMKVPYICEELQNLMGPGEVFDGELVSLITNEDMTYTSNFPHVQGVINSLPARAIDIANNYGHLHYVVFDYLRTDIEDYIATTPFKDRIVHRDNILLFPGTYVYSVSKLTDGLIEDFDDDTYLGLTETGFEGAVVKHLSSLYLPGKRTRGWYKMKQTFEVEVVLTGVQEGIGKFEGTMGAVLFSQFDDRDKLVYRGQCSGFDDELRKWVWDNREKLIADRVVMSVQHMGLMEGGIHFRHPQFKRFREDKDAEEVSWHNL